MRAHILLIILFIIAATAVGCGKTGEVVKDVPSGEVIKAPEAEIADVGTEEQESSPAEQGEIAEPTQPAEVEIIELPEESTEEAEPQNVVVIDIRNLRFLPSDITIPAGTTVVWRHQDKWIEGMKHMITIYYTDTPTKSPTLYYGDSWNYTFTKPKKHIYIDSIYQKEMRGTIEVTG